MRRILVAHLRMKKPGQQWRMQQQEPKDHKACGDQGGPNHLLSGVFPRRRKSTGAGSDWLSLGHITTPVARSALPASPA